jgi:hypothetical protein
MVVGIDVLREIAGYEVISHRETGDFSNALEEGIKEALALYNRGVSS